MVNDEANIPQPASELIGYDSSALSLDGRSLNIPNDGTEEDMSSLGTSKWGGYNFSTGNAIGYIGNMRIVGRAEDYSREEGAPVPPYRSPTPSPYDNSGASAVGDYDFQQTDYSVQTEERGRPTLMVEQQQKNEKEEKKKSGCLPTWVVGAPFWLKLIIISSTALLIGAVVLIGVGATLAKDSIRSSAGNEEPNQPVASSDVPVPPPVATQNPTTAPTSEEMEDNPTNTAVIAPTTSPLNMTPERPFVPTFNSSDPSSQANLSSTVNFFAIGGRFDDGVLSTVVDNLQTLPSIDGTTFMIHLGDWNSPYATSCAESSYTRNVEVFQQSAIPVYFVLGDNEFNDCPNPDQALSFWYDHLLGFETQFWPEPAWNVTRQTPDHPANFAFGVRNVLFIGLSLVGGIVHNQEEWDTRHSANLRWINETVAARDGDFETLVVMAHADPDIDINENFFASFYTMVQEYDEKVVFVHRNLGIDSWQLEPNFNAIPNLDVVVVEGSLWPPMWLQINTETGSLLIDQGSWYQDYLTTGTMPPSPSQSSLGLLTSNFVQKPNGYSRMSFHFASSEYTRCFQGIPTPDAPKLRTSTIEYLETFDKESWYKDPIVSLLNGKGLRGGKMVDTVNALGDVNGRQEYATPEQIQLLKNHITNFWSSTKDLRDPLRRIEQKLLHEYAGFLIGNQCLDFQKQDGITEIEESIMANHVERNLNDLVLREEEAGRIVVNRQPIYVSAVSNFTNFLDLFRKTVRSLELGIPCVVLGRSNTVQHSYRWTKLLVDLCQEEGIDPGMITYLSCPLEDIKDITQSCKEATGNLYATCSRQLAEDIKSSYPNTVASTGGPNTLVIMEWTEAFQDAIRMSASIESSGQCTALRHVVAPAGTTEDDVSQMLGGIPEINEASSAMKEGIFDGVFSNHKGSPSGPSQDGYKRHPIVDASYRLANTLPPNDIDEYWRKVVVDISALDVVEHLDGLVDWLNSNQPISLAINGTSKEQSMELGFELWERTGLVVNTIGSPQNPALTCQARPQEGEVFGEFPPRRLLNRFTKFPVVVPSSTPSYDAIYTENYLLQQAQFQAPGEVGSFLGALSNDLVKGYCVTLYQYLLDATLENPKTGFGTARTAVWGLQRPPLGTTTYLVCDSALDDVAPSLFLFLVTNAKDQVTVVSRSEQIKSVCITHGIKLIDSVDEDSLAPGDNFKEISGPTSFFPMVGHFLTTLFPIGHIKSTTPGDKDFLRKVALLKKWLRVL
ncbi:hypothetical protein IV203_001677 [Nitzschia inconspicua]|uniref:Uncharacterized protein n=1 Tax=Nitzschia inconspicua TaxID=303405 RepID=A0A9K3L711_9STRA|nr:hypothetical protein IV203_001677 [Nitzschia inconspicua]